MVGALSDPVCLLQVRAGSGGRDAMRAVRVSGVLVLLETRCTPHLGVFVQVWVGSMARRGRGDGGGVMLGFVFPGLEMSRGPQGTPRFVL